MLDRTVEPGLPIFQWLSIILILLGFLLIGTEVFLRRKFGFGNPLLYVPDNEIGYRLSPDQHVRRFGNHILINAYSMRGLAIAPTPPAETLRIMLLGDSIANGGWWTAQDETIAARLQEQLHHPAQQRSFARVEVLNASANSWGPRNELAYLKRFGTFGSPIVLSIINTDDLFSVAPHSALIGRARNYRIRKPPLALVEMLQLKVLPARPIPEWEAIQREEGDRVSKNLDAIQQMQAFATQHSAQFLLVMTPLLRELGNPGPRDYELAARDRLTALTQQQSIPYLDLLHLLNQEADPQSFYRDNIHFNAEGYRVLARTISKELLEGAIATVPVSLP